jgi:hypothetical protein
VRRLNFTFVAWDFFVNDFCEYAAYSTILKKLKTFKLR